MKRARKGRHLINSKTAVQKKAVVNGPSPFEIEYLRQLQEELQIFLHSSCSTTIKGVYLGIQGSNYRGYLRAGQ